MESTQVTTVTHEPTVATKVVGRDRYKYFKRPMVEGELPLNYEVRDIPRELPNESPTRTIGTQSLYRESDVQTDPYSPLVQVRDGDDPEVLNLARLGLGFGRGLPAGLEEVELIERLRQRKEFEASLPPLTDPATFGTRQKMMEEQELREHAFRAEQIRKLQQQRLNMLEHALQDREDDRERAHKEQLERILEPQHQQKEATLAKLQATQLKQLRNLNEQRNQLQPRKPRRNIIDDYANFASKVYSSKIRDGTPKLARHFTISELPDFNNMKALEDLTTMESKKDKSLKEIEKLSRIEPKREVLQFRAQLAKVDATLRANKMQNGVQAELPPPSVAQKIERPLPRPPTPTVHPVNQSPRAHVAEDDQAYELHEAQTRAVILLQRLLRGRAVQNMMYEGKERRRELIEELRTVITEEQLQQDAEKHEQHLEKHHKERLAEGKVSAAVGEVVGATLDFLAKELVRLNELKRIQRFVLLAENTRRMREAEESGLRQREDIARAVRDEEYRQLCLTHQGTIPTYLDSLVEDAAHIAAARQARDVLSRTQSIASPGQAADDLAIRDLVANFLLVVVDKASQKDHVDFTDQVFAKAVQDSLASVKFLL